MVIGVGASESRDGEDTTNTLNYIFLIFPTYGYYMLNKYVLIGYSIVVSLYTCIQLIHCID